MKKEDVPQDAGKLGGLLELAYVVSASGAYTTVQSSGWAAKNVANDRVWEELGRHQEAALREVKEGLKSPLAYHMVRFQMNEEMLADYTRFSRRKIRRHLTPDGFRALEPDDLRRYADSFNIKVDELCTTP